MRVIRPRAVWVPGMLALAALLSAGRPVAAIPYHGAPDLKLTVDMVTAGTGANGFDAKKLFATMFGDRMPAEASRLTRMFGPQPVANFFPIMDFTIADVVRMVKRDNVTLPAADSPLVPQRVNDSLYASGIVPSGRHAGRYDVGYMIERLISHKYHHELMMDYFRKYRRDQVGAFHTVLGQAIKDAANKG